MTQQMEMSTVEAERIAAALVPYALVCTEGQEVVIKATMTARTAHEVAAIIRAGIRVTNRRNEDVRNAQQRQVRTGRAGSAPVDANATRQSPAPQQWPVDHWQIRTGRNRTFPARIADLALDAVAGSPGRLALAAFGVGAWSAAVFWKAIGG